jgi:metal-dependent amidase/aminoacylase/carboxypeptidase family protein
MIEEGCLKDINEIYGMHNMPICPINQIHCIAGPVMAAIYVFKITIIGSGGHGSDPKLSNNPIIPSIRIYERYLVLVD